MTTTRKEYRIDTWCSRTEAEQIAKQLQNPAQGIHAEAVEFNQWRWDVRLVINLEQTP